jgi:CelD/BcsL family acetyltransferase involved in cellulose biosynthesis
LKTPALHMLSSKAVVKKSFQIGRHLYMELGSEEELCDIFEKFVKLKELKFEGLKVQPDLHKLERKPLH